MASARLRALLLAAAAAVSLTACGGGGSGDAPGAAGDSATGVDDGANLSMWVRANGTGSYSQALVDAYNASHKNHVTLTAVPDANYQQKVGVAAGSGSLPDLLTSDVAYAPNYSQQGIWADITSRVQALPFHDALVGSHVKAATADGKTYAVPHKVDSSVILYNADLFTKAGLDPKVPPKTFTDLYNDAKAIRATGGDTYGFYFAGNCPGCNAYTAMPYAVAAGTPPISPDGKSADVHSPALQEAFALYKRMFDEGIVPSSAKTESGSTWTTLFEAGKVGILPAGSFEFANLAKVNFKWGIAPIMSPDGKATSTYVGGDDLGIAANSKKAAQAWNFIAWTLDQKTQVDVVAKAGNLPVRTDLAGNQYTTADPRFAETAKGLEHGYTPASLAYGQVFNDNTGPWNQLVQQAVFGSGDAKQAFETAQSAIQAKLQAGN
ncbi:ABC transporter substrate-binding protein [Amycolatopsis jejuensis]|uniref:ABC transporter substrate-binding protein n=1 Tax=Amycolatopsis jejuensis TaxID=330084 RepID=UPI0005275FD8|nr:sugar ABC transporter substrate-binding protein [Amycolatopsis jejuensis]